MKAPRIICFAAMALLVSCGRQVDLRPEAGQKMPVKPLMARTTPTVEDLLTIPTYAKPDRVDELMRRSRPRPQDPFNLPPPTGGAAPSLPPNSDSLPATNQPQDGAQPAPGMPVTPPTTPGD